MDLKSAINDLIIIKNEQAYYETDRMFDDEVDRLVFFFIIIFIISREDQAPRVTII